MVMTIHVDLGAKYRAVVRELAVVRMLLEQHPERITELKVALKVDRSAEDFGERHRELDVLSRLVDGRDQ